MERIKQLPWSWILSILWLIISQILSFRLVLLPVTLIVLYALLAPIVLPVALLLLIVPAVFGLLAWIALAFKKKVLASILSGVALSIGLIAHFAVNKLLGETGIDLDYR